MSKQSTLNFSDQEIADLEYEAYLTHEEYWADIQEKLKRMNYRFTFLRNAAGVIVAGMIHLRKDGEGPGND